jgi:hypothetical protein
METRLHSAFLVLMAGLAAAADMRMSVDQLVTFIRSSIQLKQPDRQVAEYLRHVKLSNKLDDRTVEELQGLGAGAKTIAALKGLRDETARLPAPPPPPPPEPMPPSIPPPNSIEQAKIMDGARQYAISYVKQLPDFICLQVTRRYLAPPGGDNWRHSDTITARLSYFEQKEDYKIVQLNGEAVTTDTPMEHVGGTVSEGEFGSMMRMIFRTESEARVGWDHWATLRGKRVCVFAYDIDQGHSQYHLVADRSLDYVPAYRGLLYIDPASHSVMRITLNPYDIPITFPIRGVKLVLDYDYTSIGDGQYLLPLKAVLTSSQAEAQTRNDVEFRMYRKFGTESTIKFDTPEPLPEDKTKERP